MARGDDAQPMRSKFAVDVFHVLQMGDRPSTLVVGCRSVAQWSSEPRQTGPSHYLVRTRSRSTSRQSLWSPDYVDSGGTILVRDRACP